MRTVSTLTFTVSIVLAGAAWADTGSTAAATAPSSAPAREHPAATAVHPAKLTCQEFLDFDATARPQIVYWAEGFNRKGKPEEAIVDVERTNRLVPVLVQICQQQPQASFWEKAKAEFKKVF